MNLKISSLPESQLATLSRAVEEIVKAIKPGKIICFGVRTKLLSAWGCFTETPTFPFTDCHLLIIKKKTDNRRHVDLIDAIDKLSCETITIWPIVHDAESVTNEILNGSFFFNTVCLGGVLLFDDNETQLPDPIDSYRAEEFLKRIDDTWNKWHGLGKKFLDSAIHDIALGHSDVALFHLHQSVEHTCSALVRCITGYRPSGHNIKRSLALVGSLAPASSNIFPCNTEEEISLLRFLDKSYSHARYDLDFAVKPEIVQTLLKRVTKLLSESEKMYANLNQSLKS